MPATGRSPRKTRSASKQLKAANKAGAHTSTAVANVNNSHSVKVSNKTAKLVAPKPNNQPKTNSIKKNLKSATKVGQPKSVVQQSVVFDENGDTMQMEVQDNEFASEEEEETNPPSHPDTDSEPEEDSENPSSDQEQNDLQNKSRDDEDTSQAPSSSEDEDMETSPPPSPRTLKRLKKLAKRRSVEDQLDTMSSALLAVKEILVHQGLTGEAKGTLTAPSVVTSDGQEADKAMQSSKSVIETTSETTIYCNALDNLEVNEEAVDSEITFNMGKHVKEANQEIPSSINKRDSSSSEDRIDTSDELMEVDFDYNDQFITECAAAADANRRKRGHQQTPEPP